MTEITKLEENLWESNYEFVFIYVEFRMTMDLQVTTDGCSIENAVQQICEFSLLNEAIIFNELPDKEYAEV